MLERAGVQTLVDVRRYPGSRRNPQYNRGALEQALAERGLAYRHAEALGGRLSGEPGEERFACIRQPAFRSYAARMGTDEWQEALASVLAEPAPCGRCAPRRGGPSVAGASSPTCSSREATRRCACHPTASSPSPRREADVEVAASISAASSSSRTLS